VSRGAPDPRPADPASGARAGAPGSVVYRAALLAFALGVGAIALGSHAHGRLPHPQPIEELAYYPSGEHLHRVTLGHAETAADLAWLRAVQYYGEHRVTDNRFDRMGHVFDILTTLAPGFIPAYVFGAFALAQEGRDFAAAERLMMKGLDANPANGALAFQAGFLYYVRPGGRDLARAAEYFEQAARQRDAPPQAARFAAFARQNAGELPVAWALWSRVYETSPNPFMRELAERKMREIRAALERGRADEVMIRLTTPQVLLLPRATE
jgi:TPR repeat protein